jgi:prepilin-type N-terminal cleavage/methylation domain-containing protein
MKKYRHRIPGKPLPGFTLIEMLIASTILLIVIVAALSIYSRSNKVAVDQQMFSEIQHDVRSSIFLIVRDARAAGVGLTSSLGGLFIEGTDTYGPGPEFSDSLKIIGNFESPLSLKVEKVAGVNVHLVENEIQNTHYACPQDLENKTILIVSTQCDGAYAFRYIGVGDVNGCSHPQGKVTLSIKPSELNPPGGLKDTGWDKDCWDNSILTFGDMKFYWLDTTGDPNDYPDFNLTVGSDGYLGMPNTLYVTSSSGSANIIHQPVAMNIETLQFQYNGDLDDDGTMDGFTDWDNSNWTILPGDDEATRNDKQALISRIRQVRIWVLGKTRNAYVSVRRDSAPAMHVYRRPAVANTPAATQDDFHRRFLLESTATIRNLSLNIYNTGER